MFSKPGRQRRAPASSFGKSLMSSYVTTSCFSALWTSIAAFWKRSRLDGFRLSPAFIALGPRSSSPLVWKVQYLMWLVNSVSVKKKTRPMAYVHVLHLTDQHNAHRSVGNQLSLRQEGSPPEQVPTSRLLARSQRGRLTIGRHLQRRRIEGANKGQALGFRKALQTLWPGRL